MTASHCFALSASARGAAHIRRGAPNQDFTGWESLGNGVFALAVADGHGAPLHARSADGARLAVEACLAEMRAAWATQADALKLEPQTGARAILAQALALWRDKVDAAIARQPLEEALAADSHTAGLGAYGPYGTTLVAALLWPGGGLALQVGDGDLLIRDSVEQMLHPIAEDAQAGEETASLCEADALAHARFAAIGTWKGALLATDGFAKSFADADTMASVARALLDRLEAGLTLPRLEADLAALSARGSSDDISIAAITGAVPSAAPQPASHGAGGWRGWIILGVALLFAALLGHQLTNPPPTPSAPAAAAAQDPAKPGPAQGAGTKRAPRQAPKSGLASANKPGGNDAGQSQADPK